MRIYAVEYCECIYESSFAVLSIHLSKRGAAKAMNRAKQEDFDQLETSIAISSTYSNSRIVKRRMEVISEAGQMDKFSYRVMEVEE